MTNTRDIEELKFLTENTKELTKVLKYIKDIYKIKEFYTDKKSLEIEFFKKSTAQDAKEDLAQVTELSVDVFNKSIIVQ